MSSIVSGSSVTSSSLTNNPAPSNLREFATSKIDRYLSKQEALDVLDSLAHGGSEADQQVFYLLSKLINRADSLTTGDLTKSLERAGSDQALFNLLCARRAQLDGDTQTPFTKAVDQELTTAFTSPSAAGGSAVLQGNISQGEARTFVRNALHVLACTLLPAAPPEGSHPWIDALPPRSRL